jgi:hypothetical protein
MKVCADAYLQEKFNVGPLISDIMGCVNTLKSVRGKVDKLRREAGTMRKRYYVRSLVDTYPDIVHIGSQDLNAAYYVVQDKIASYRTHCHSSLAKFVVSMSYKYDLPHMSEQEMLVKAYLDSLGVNLNPAIIWNAIPWSFVVDWVLGIGQFLDQFKARNIEPTVHIQSCCWSFHHKRQVSFNGGVGGTQIAYWDEDSYLREPTFPGLSSIRSSGLSLTESSLAAALAVGRV